MIDPKLAALVEHASLPAALFSTEGTLVKMNEAYKRLFGITLPALVEGKYKLAQDALFLKSLRSADDLTAVLRGDSALSVTIHYPLALADPAFGFEKKESLVLEVSAFPAWGEGGRIAGTVVLYRNVTDVHRRQVQLAESEKRYRTLTEALPDMLFCVAPDQTVLFVNNFSARQFRTTPEQITGKKITELFPQPIFERMWRNIEQVFATGKPLYTENKTYFGETMRWLDTWLVPLCDTQGNVYSIMGVSRDITEKIKYKEELESVRNLESLGILAGGIAHDFNNILAALLGNLSLLKENLAPASGDYGILEQAEAAVARAGELTARLLTFSKGGAPVRERASIRDLICDSTEFIIHGTAARSDFSLPVDLWTCEFDAGQVSQVIQNIVMNAVQAMPRGGVVSVSASNTVLEDNHVSGFRGRFVRIAVTDAGVGISEEDLEKIFVPFFTTKSEGKGLGLSICYSIIKKHGGFLNVESKPGVGTTVAFFLPALEHAVDADPAGGGPPSKKDKTGRRVLVIDDEAFVRFTLEKSLLHLGCRPVLATGGEEGFNLYLRSLREGNPFDVVIIDLTIPGGAGGSVIIADLLKTDPKVKAIVMSGYPNSPVINDPASFGFRAVLKKPFSVTDLEKALDSIL
jgi:PAS domain S-box-containing protein